MVQPENEEVLTCPACGAPRLEHAWDCLKCGAVFDEIGGPEPPQEASAGSVAPPPPKSPARQPAAPGRSSSAKRGSAARRSGPARRPKAARRPSAALTSLRGWVEQNKAVAIILSFIIYVVVIWLFGVVIIGATGSPGAVKEAYRDITGRPLPKGFGPGFAAHLVGREWVALNRPDQVVLVLYTEGKGRTDEDLRLVAERVLELIEVPWEVVRTRSATIGGQKVEVPVWELVGEGGPHLYLLPISTVDGDRAVEAVLGRPDQVLEVVEEMARNR